MFGNNSGVETLDCDVLYFVDLTGVINRILLVDSQNEVVDVECIVFFQKLDEDLIEMLMLQNMFSVVY